MKILRRSPFTPFEKLFSNGTESREPARFEELRW